MLWAGDCVALRQRQQHIAERQFAGLRTVPVAERYQAFPSLVGGSVSIFDATSGVETGPRCYHLHPPHSGPTWAALDPVRRRVLGYGEGAWRSVGCVIPDETGMPMWLPLEAFADEPRPTAG